LGETCGVPVFRSGAPRHVGTRHVELSPPVQGDTRRAVRRADGVHMKRITSVSFDNNFLLLNDDEKIDMDDICAVRIGRDETLLEEILSIILIMAYFGIWIILCLIFIHFYEHFEDFKELLIHGGLKTEGYQLIYEINYVAIIYCGLLMPVGIYLDSNNIPCTIYTNKSSTPLFFKVAQKQFRDNIFDGIKKYFDTKNSLLLLTSSYPSPYKCIILYQYIQNTKIYITVKTERQYAFFLLIFLLFIIIPLSYDNPRALSYLVISCVPVFILICVLCEAMHYFFPRLRRQYLGFTLSRHQLFFTGDVEPLYEFIINYNMPLLSEKTHKNYVYTITQPQKINNELLKTRINYNFLMGLLQTAKVLLFCLFLFICGSFIFGLFILVVSGIGSYVSFYIFKLPKTTMISLLTSFLDLVGGILFWAGGILSFVANIITIYPFLRKFKQQQQLQKNVPKRPK
jgi:hypothetical protein